MLTFVKAAADKVVAARIAKPSKPARSSRNLDIRTSYWFSI
jgi:hypothetical protein